MEELYYIGLDIHKKTIAYCIKTKAGKTIKEGTVAADRSKLGVWAAAIDRPWIGAMEATLFTNWIFDFLKDYALEVKVAHPEMLKAISASKKKPLRTCCAVICCPNVTWPRKRFGSCAASCVIAASWSENQSA